MSPLYISGNKHTWSKPRRFRVLFRLKYIYKQWNLWWLIATEMHHYNRIMYWNSAHFWLSAYTIYELLWLSCFERSIKAENWRVGDFENEFFCRHIRNKLFASCQEKEMAEDSWAAVTVLRQNVVSHNVYVTKRNCYLT